MPNPDASREAAHRRYEAAKDITQNNPDVNLDDALAQTYWNVDWQPGDPTYQEVQDNWDYYSQATNGGQIPTNAVPRPQFDSQVQSPLVDSLRQDQTVSPREQLFVSPREMQETESKRNDILAGLSKIGDLLQSNVFTSGWDAANDEDENNLEQKRDDERNLDPRFEKNPRYLEMVSGVSDMGLQSAPNNIESTGSDLSNLRQGVSDFFNTLEPIRQDYLERESELPTQSVPEINIPSLESIAQAQGDFFDREQQQKLDEMNRPGLTQGEDLDRYRKLFDSHGGLQNDYVTANKDILNSLINLSLENSSYDRGEIPTSNAYGDLVSGLDKLANENFDDGSMRSDAVKSKYMTLPVYKEYVEAGFGGRSLEELNEMDEGTVFNKLDEARDHGFRPYIEDEAQLSNWIATQAADDMTKAFNAFGDTRDLLTDAGINYNGQRYGRDNFYDNAGTYFDDINKLIEDGKVEMVPADDPSVDPENDMPMTIWWSFPGTDIQVASDQEMQYQWSEDGSKLYAWLPGHEDQAVEYYGIEDYEANRPEWNAYRTEEGDPVHRYWKIPKLEYMQDDGTQVSLPYSSVEEMSQSMANGTADMNWGPLNIAKDANDRKGFGDMFATGDFSDIVPNMVDLAAGSAPLFTPITAWPMAIANAGTAIQGLDPRLYDSDTNTYRRLSDDMTGEKYLSNIVLSGLVPATEKIAGVIGGSGGALGKPLQAALERIGAPAAARSAMDVLGEGAEESVASAWEDYQTNGLSDWFANPIYKTDEDGNTLMQYNPATGQDEPVIDYDESGHEKRDSNTSLSDRISNWWQQQPDNFFAGTALGAAIGGPGIVRDAATGSGYYADSRERKLLRDLEKMNNLPRFREAKRGNVKVTIGPEDIGTYGKKEN